ncbi:UDP-N-acetylmuramate dehydrogenase [Vibrio astriarenae]
MQFKSHTSLAPYHTFGIEQTCQHLVEVSSVDELIELYQSPQWQDLPKLFVGKGSNMLFTEAYQGIVVINQLLGKQVTQTDDAFHLHIEGGEDWPSLVAWCVEQGYDGLENLALIPGCCGSAPIQNIGAYGVEFADVCEYVDILCLESFSIKRLTRDECLFGYRDSIFKHALYEKAIVVAVGLMLAKAWQANTQYGPLKAIGEPTAKAIFERVCQVRMEKLPDPAQSGNAGSFFKNPVISHEHYQTLVEQYPNMVAYPADSGMKVAAGWLIDQCGLKGQRQGGAQVHPNQALVIVNKDSASAEDVVVLAATVRDAVWQKYRIALEHEVRFMGAKQETRLERIVGELQ